MMQLHLETQLFTPNVIPKTSRSH